MTIGSFFLMAGTGTVMFFKFDNGIMALVHRLFSWVFMLGALNHLAANIRPLSNHLKSLIGKLSVATFVTILLASFFSWGQVTSPKLIKPIETALVETPLGTLAQVSRTPPKVLVARFRDAGVVARPEQSIRVIAAVNHTSENRLLGMIFLSSKPDRESKF
ncbi:MAG TPA: hypothetical protein VMF50_07060 [Candidatus Binataceae bacterium]|nr:hypothetical protein [Candidatus Binataceae bacterium]